MPLTFRQPARPQRPLTPRASKLGLDRLAQEKRNAALNDENGRKRPRLEESIWANSRTPPIDAFTPRVARGGSLDEGEGVFDIDMREWEEEQVKLDRDWYTGAEGSMLADEERNPFSQYEELNIAKQAEMAAKQTVRFY
jgi:pre-mRNA-splicing factor ATP-dependent RNA helicase DHX38/PRP16